MAKARMPDEDGDTFYDAEEHLLKEPEPDFTSVKDDQPEDQAFLSAEEHQAEEPAEVPNGHGLEASESVSLERVNDSGSSSLAPMSSYANHLGKVHSIPSILSSPNHASKVSLPSIPSTSRHLTSFRDESQQEWWSDEDLAKRADVVNQNASNSERTERELMSAGEIARSLMTLRNLERFACVTLGAALLPRWYQDSNKWALGSGLEHTTRLRL